MPQYWRAVALASLAAVVPHTWWVAQSQAATLTCTVLVPPSDSGSGRIDVVAPGAKGRLAWTDGRPGQFLLRDSGGRIRVIGRPGSGPGEFQTISGMSWIADTLWVGDARLPRVQFFTDTGGLLRVRTALLPATWGPRPDGALVGITHRPLAVDVPFTVLAHQPESTRNDTVASFPLLAVERVMVPAGGREVPNPHPLLAQTQVAASPEQDRYCSATPADASSVRLLCVDAYGRRLLEKQVTLSVRPITDSIYNGVIDMFSRAPGRTPDLMRGRISRPRSLPPVLGMLLASDGDIWLARTHRLESIASWTRLRSDGTIRDTITFPAKYRVLRLQGNTAWAAAADADDLQTLFECTIKG